MDPANDKRQAGHGQDGVDGRGHCQTEGRAGGGPPPAGYGKPGNEGEVQSRAYYHGGIEAQASATVAHSDRMGHLLETFLVRSSAVPRD